jgi:hypothetical protein
MGVLPFKNVGSTRGNDIAASKNDMASPQPVQNNGIVHPSTKRRYPAQETSMLCVAHALSWGRKALVSAGLAAASGLLFSQSGICADGPLVATDAGTVQGLFTPTGASYLGIPYAAPPLGSLRWKAPTPAPAWSGVRPATTAGQACKQDGALPPAGVPGSGEDCL